MPMLMIVEQPHDRPLKREGSAQNRITGLSLVEGRADELQRVSAFPRYNAALVKQYGASPASTVWSTQTYGRTPTPFSLTMQTVHAHPFKAGYRRRTDIEGCGE